MKTELTAQQDKAAKVIKKSVTFGLPVIKIATLLFIVMKVFNLGIVGGWSWGWVLSPIWLPFVALIALVLGFLVVTFIVLFIYYSIESWRTKRRLRKKFKRYGR